MQQLHTRNTLHVAGKRTPRCGWQLTQLWSMPWQSAWLIGTAPTSCTGQDQINGETQQQFITAVSLSLSSLSISSLLSLPFSLPLPIILLLPPFLPHALPHSSLHIYWTHTSGIPLLIVMVEDYIAGLNVDLYTHSGYVSTLTSPHDVLLSSSAYMVPSTDCMYLWHKMRRIKQLVTLCPSGALVLNTTPSAQRVTIGDQLMAVIADERLTWSRVKSYQSGVLHDHEWLRMCKIWEGLITSCGSQT